MNKLNVEKKASVVGMLCEGSSIRAVERITGIHGDTITRLGVRIGAGCQRIMDNMMRNLPCRLIQVDEVWGYVGNEAKDRAPPTTEHAELATYGRYAIALDTWRTASSKIWHPDCLHRVHTFLATHCVLTPTR